jgi:hypothetical protein
MSRGPGRIQRVILDMIATPEASAAYVPDHPNYDGYYGRGPVGVPIDAVIAKVYGGEPTRAQRNTVQRATRLLQSNRLAAIYYRPVCPVDLSVDPSGFYWRTGYVGCGCRAHSRRMIVGRQRAETDPDPEYPSWHLSGVKERATFSNNT